MCLRCSLIVCTFFVLPIHQLDRNQLSAQDQPTDLKEETVSEKRAVGGWLIDPAAQILKEVGLKRVLYTGCALLFTGLTTILGKYAWRQQPVTRDQQLKEPKEVVDSSEPSISLKRTPAKRDLSLPRNDLLVSQEIEGNRSHVGVRSMQQTGTGRTDEFPEKEEEIIAYHSTDPTNAYPVLLTEKMRTTNQTPPSLEELPPIEEDEEITPLSSPRNMGPDTTTPKISLMQIEAPVIQNPKPVPPPFNPQATYATGTDPKTDLHLSTLSTTDQKNSSRPLNSKETHLARIMRERRKKVREETTDFNQSLDLGQNEHLKQLSTKELLIENENVLGDLDDTSPKEKTGRMGKINQLIPSKAVIINQRKQLKKKKTRSKSRFNTNKNSFIAHLKKMSRFNMFQKEINDSSKEEPNDSSSDGDWND